MAIGTTMAILGGIQAGTSLVSGIMGSKASKKAAQTQTAAAAEAGRVAEAAAGKVNPQIQAASDDAIGWVTDAAGEANARLDPYSQAGTGALEKLTGLADEQFTFSQDDPSYQWRLEQGQKALERSAAARGGATGGAAAKSLLRYAQGAASQEYGAAFDRFNTDRNSRAGMLSNLAGLGYGAAARQGGNSLDAAQFGGDMRFRSTGLQGQNTMDAARTRAEMLAGAGNATAAGQVGSANAWTQALGGGANSFGEMLMLSQLMRQGGGVNPNINWGNPDTDIATLQASTVSPVTAALLPPPSVRPFRG